MNLERIYVKRFMNESEQPCSENDEKYGEYMQRLGEFYDSLSKSIKPELADDRAFLRSVVSNFIGQYEDIDEELLDEALNDFLSKHTAMPESASNEYNRSLAESIVTTLNETFSKVHLAEISVDDDKIKLNAYAEKGEGINTQFFEGIVTFSNNSAFIEIVNSTIEGLGLAIDISDLNSSIELSGDIKEDTENIIKAVIEKNDVVTDRIQEHNEAAPKDEGTMNRGAIEFDTLGGDVQIFTDLWEKIQTVGFNSSSRGRIDFIRKTDKRLVDPEEVRTLSAELYETIAIFVKEAVDEYDAKITAKMQELGFTKG